MIDTTPYILTPPPGPLPRITGPRVFGVRPGKPVLFKVSATGKEPLSYAARDLPAGLSLDPHTGLITGQLDRATTHRITLQVSGPAGHANRELRIVVGDEISLTPPMGWNSWYCWSESVDDDKVRAIAQAMKDKGLVDHGWSYVNIDDCWQGLRGGPYHAIQGNEKFPDMTTLGRDIHALGLKFGIYSTCWQSSYAGFIGGTAPNAEGDYTAHYVPQDQQLNPGQYFGRHPSSSRLRMATIGPHWFVDADARQFADWGVDYVKYDWKNWTLKDGIEDAKPKAESTLKRFMGDFREVNRDIVLSLSPVSEPGNGERLARHSNLWRITGDITDSWASISRGFALSEWYPHTRPGHYCDLDMLQIGNFGIPNQQNRTLQSTQLLPDEQYTQVSLWALLSMPLILSCDIETLDDFTLNLITNDEVIDINQDPLCRPATRVSQNGTQEIWVKDMEDGSKAIGFFNLGSQPADITVTWPSIGIEGQRTVRDVWRQQDVADTTTDFATTVPSHGVRLVRVH